MQVESLSNKMYRAKRHLSLLNRYNNRKPYVDSYLTKFHREYLLSVEDESIASILALYEYTVDEEIDQIFNIEAKKVKGKLKQVLFRFTKKPQDVVGEKLSGLINSVDKCLEMHMRFEKDVFNNNLKQHFAAVHPKNFQSVDGLKKCDKVSVLSNIFIDNYYEEKRNSMRHFYFIRQYKKDGSGEKSHCFYLDEGRIERIVCETSNINNYTYGGLAISEISFKSPLVDSGRSLKDSIQFLKNLAEYLYSAYEVKNMIFTYRGDFLNGHYMILQQSNSFGEAPLFYWQGIDQRHIRNDYCTKRPGYNFAINHKSHVYDTFQSLLRSFHCITLDIDNFRMIDINRIDDF